MKNEDKFFEVLREESDFPLNDSLFRYIVSHSSEVSADKGDSIIKIGECDPDFYIVKEGIVRGYILDEGEETNLYFGMEGTLLCSMASYWDGKPSIICVEACSPTRLLRIEKNDILSMMTESHEFCRWVTGVFMKMSYFSELKGKIMNGDAKWRYEWLERCRPELFEAVPLKAIASYLRMSRVHVSRIRNQILKRNGN
ncbi:MAG: Crp/Fnr family transcriptional regulator [Muribaculaceae bacterium]|nr:Crp/Fnr family transcriptional regulator [Muribaculaceae bacterium]